MSLLFSILVFFASAQYQPMKPVMTGHVPGPKLQAATDPEYDFYPSKKPDSPILVFVHGGAWISGSAQQYKDFAYTWARRGVCVAVAKYRLAPVFRHPIPIKDLNEALDKITKRKFENCNSKRVFLMGHSAGAHMIAYWNSEYSIPTIKGFIGVEGIYDLPLLAKTWPTYPNWFINEAFTPNQKTWVEASPQSLTMKSKLDWLLIHSKEDELVDIPQTKNFQKHLEKQGVTGFYHEVKGTHFDVIEKQENDGNETVKIIQKFMSER